MILDVIHTSRPEGDFKTRHLYPPRDLYHRVAKLCNAMVIGSCRIGDEAVVDLASLEHDDFAAQRGRRSVNSGQCIGSGNESKHETWSNVSSNSSKGKDN